MVLHGVRPALGGAGRIFSLKSPPSPRLGETENVSFEEHTLALNPGELIVWCTDGIIECENASGESYGKRRLTDVLERTLHETADTVRNTAIREAYSFFSGHPARTPSSSWRGRS